MTSIDRSIEHIAREQHGAFSIHQARSVGATDAMIRTRVRSGAWRREVRGVYTLAAFRRTWEQRLMCAVLSKPGSVISGLPGPAVHQLEGFLRTAPELAVPPGTNSESKIALVHRFADIESTKVGGLPVVTARQSLFDVAGRVPYLRLRRAAEAAIANGTFTIEDLGERFLELVPLQLAGIGAMRSIVEEFGRAGFVPAQSMLESLLYGVLDGYGVPYVRQAALPWRAPHPMNVDALIPAWRLIIEADGRRWHSRLDDLERDLDRDNAAAAHGHHVLRFTYRALTEDLSRVRSTIDQYLRTMRAAA